MILTRQFRFPVFINGHEDDLIEAAAGLLDNMDPESRIKAEAEEETGYRVSRVEKVFEAYMSPAPSRKNSIFISQSISRRIGPAQAAASSQREKISTCWKCRWMRPCAVLIPAGLSTAKRLCCFYHIALKGVL